MLVEINTRCTEMQDWPAYENPPQATRAAAYLRSASSCTITPALPPSSRVTRLKPARLFNPQPTAGLPVKVSNLMRASSTRGAALVVDDGTTANPASGQPASRISSPSLSALTGVALAGRMMMGLPAAREGATLWATKLRGKLNGEIPTTGPRGTRCTCPTRPSLPGSQSRAMISP